MIPIAKIFLLVFGVLTILGGIYGFVKVDSPASLIAGGLLGALLVVSSILLPGKPTAGLIMGLVLSILIAGRFIPATIKTLSNGSAEGASMMTTLPMSVLAVAGIVITILGLIKR